ncbi:MAG: HlyC/CorC family transporter [Acidimicrobiia bacterium]|nr:HlyC/CorC family transporter [Acidimicrobiia bacterium]
MVVALGLVVVLCLILATGVFVAFEFSLLALNRVRMDSDAEANQRGARAASEAVASMSFHLSGAQLGITVTSLIVGFLAKSTVAGAIEPAVARVVGEGAASGISTGLALVGITAVSMVIGELAPKSLAIAKPQAVAYALAPPMLVVVKVARPLIRLLNGAANATVRRLGIEPQEELNSVRSLQELELLIRASDGSDGLEASLIMLLTRSIRFGGTSVASALVPRHAVRSLSIDDSIADLVALAQATNYSRFPVVGTDLDDVLGVVQVKQVYTVAYDQRRFTTMAEIMEPAFVVIETRGLTDLLSDLRGSEAHLAIVVDEHGGTAGIITLEDVLEEIVGEIRDEYDEADAVVVSLPRPIGAINAASPEAIAEWMLAGSLDVDAVFEASGFQVPPGDYQTLAGFVLQRLGRIPTVGEAFDVDGWRFEVAEIDRQRVVAVAVRRDIAGADGWP